MTARPDREVFGRRLRTVRENAHLTGRDLAVALGWPGSKVSKIEHGKQTPTNDDVIAWAAATGVSPDQLADLLAELHAIRIDLRAWSRVLRRGTAARQRAAAPLDASTSLVRAFEPAVVPGLLQTAEYARHVLTAVVALRGVPADVPYGVRARLERQHVLYEPGKRFCFLVTDAALRSLVCPPGVLRGQLDRLVVVAGLPGVELRVLGIDVPLPFPAVHGFWIYDDRVVLVDTVSAELVIRDPDDVRLHQRVFAQWWDLAAAGESAVAAVRRAAEALPRTGAPDAGP